MYKISVPLINASLTEESIDKYVRELKEARAERVLMVPRGSHENLEEAKERGLSLRKNAEKFIEQGIEPAIWVGSTVGHGSPLAGVQTQPVDAKYQTLVNLAGDILPDTFCPFDKKFRSMTAKYVATIAKYSGIKLIFLDDDYRLSQHGKEFCCACELHMARIRELCGENVSRAELKKLAFESKANKYRSAWLTAQRESLELLARDIRAEVDKIDESVCVSICAAHSIWGVDGSSAVDISKILAGKNKPVTRLHPAPYWATHSTMALPIVFEISRMFAWFSKDSGSELVSEGDTYPRPRYNTPASHLELFDAVMRADGIYDGALKYMIDYCSPFDYERGYVKRHIRNLPVMDDISKMFDGKECVGVYAPVDKDVMEYADFEMGSAYDNNYPHPTAARMLSQLSIPTTYCNNGICTALFGENARKFELDSLKDGAILDAISAKILTERGVDVGLVGDGHSFVYSASSIVHTPEGDSLVCLKRQNGRFMLGEISERCEVLAELELAGKGRVPFVYRYENENGQKFIVCTEDTLGTPNISSVTRGYYMQKIITEGVEWISGKKLPATCQKNPELYILCKKSADGKKMSVGLFNCYADSIIDPVVVLDGEYSKIRFAGEASGHLIGNKVCFEKDIPAFEFAAFEVER